MNRFEGVTKPLMWFMALLLTALVAGCGGGSQDPILGSPALAPGLISVIVTPATTSIPIGAPKQFVATATYADGTSNDVTASSTWDSGDTSVATVNSTSGLAIGVATGASAITANFGGKSGSATLTVTAATLSLIAVTPATASTPMGLTKPFVATGSYSDGTTFDISNLVTWASGDTNVATVNSTSGLATGVSIGSATITATLGAESGSATLAVTAATLSLIAVTPATASTPMGLTKPFVATGTYSDGTTVNISNLVTWASGDTSVATVNSTSGLATGVSIGSATITATLGAKSGSATLTVTAATLSLIVVTPATDTVAIGGTRTFVATGSYSDGTTVNISNLVTWTSDNLPVATVVSPGVATGLSAGPATITATLGAKSGSATLTVTAATLSLIVVTPATDTVAIGGTRTFVATGSYSDGTTVNISNLVTWTSDNLPVATVVSPGVATGLSAGSATITATLSAEFGSATLTVSAALAANPTAPDLGEAGRYVILASQAVTTTVGSLIYNGDIGNMDQARATYITGFTPSGSGGDFVELTGGSSYAADDLCPAPYTCPIKYSTLVVGDTWTDAATMITQVRTDLGIADTFLAADPNPGAPTQVAPIELGNLVLTRGVYRNAANIGITTGPLHLDAQGDPTSVFIIVTDGTLTTGASGSIVLDNGALARNVYWRSAGITTIAADTIFYGNVFANTQVNVLAGANITGRLFGVTDRVTLISNTVTKAP